MHRPLCCEFPNDNPLLDACAWLGAAPITDEAPTEEPPSVLMTLRAPPPSVDEEPLELDLDALAAKMGLEADVLEADLEEAPVSGAVTIVPPEPRPVEGFAAFVDTLVEVAFAAGAPRAAAALPVLMAGSSVAEEALDDLARDALVAGGLAVMGDTGWRASDRLAALVAAWRAVLDNGDFSGCGAITLVEWAAELLAAALGTPDRAQAMQYELRRHGVAAFGMVRQAA